MGFALRAGNGGALVLGESGNGGAHRFTHTFATDLLLAGVPLDRVATLLGHTNSKITEKHYAPWIRARQEQLEADVRQSWALESGTVSSGAAAYPALGITEHIN